MRPGDEAARLAQAISEGMNCLGIFLCGPALAKSRAEAPALLKEWVTAYEPAFRKVSVAWDNRHIDRQAYVSAVAKVSLLASAGIDLDAPDQLARLRAAIREMFEAIRIPLPTLPSNETAVCELHGAACPVASGELE